MKKKIFVVIVSITVLALSSCNSNPVDSPPQPGRRDYTWTIDELNPGNETLYLMRIWGSSPSDVWAVGRSSWTATSLWHYNGIQWRCDSIPRNIPNPTGLFGINGNEVWLGNGNSTIWKYDGTQWLQYGEYKITGYDYMLIEDFDGTSRDNIFGVGGAAINNSNTYKAVIMYYNGAGWSLISIPDVKVGFEFARIDPRSGVLVISGTIYDPSGFVPKVYCWDGKELKDLAFNGPGDSFVTKLGDEIFVSVGSKIYKYSNKQLSLWQDNTNTSISGRLWCGRNMNDSFMQDANGISHYNGTDYSLLYKTNLYVGLGTIFEKDVFFIAYDHTTGKDYIIHGQLK